MIPKQSVTHLPVEVVIPHPANVRERLGDLDELCASIREHGIVQPLVVTEHPTDDGRFVILAGHRRYAASKRVGLTVVPCVIRHGVTTEAEHIAIMLVENVQRHDLGPVEKAHAYGALSKRGMSQSEIARLVGVRVGVVHYYLSLLELDAETLAEIKAGTVNVGHAHDLVKAERAARRALDGHRKRGQPVVAEPAHLTHGHPLAERVRTTCDHTRRPKVGHVGCGQCWEQVIRDDQTALADVDDPRYGITPDRAEATG